ncbi:Transposon Ty3-I Gag-Pol polyprotein [Gossypium australe]|uniref:Transposon Ty3-I Gag-Pol polyprotein n=1 Tax=Gossypium australe TaxID=47621 RepID=A0A5B6WK78_9ROSI|nr:Transposon Ty3-I Gag-Pol polyprotein [Gossypium australe]
MSDAATNSESPFERDMCLEETQDFKNDRDCNLSPDLLRMVEQEEKHILPYKESVEIVSLEEGNEVANIVPVPKKDGKVRMCVDYRDLNKASRKDNFPLPHIDTLMDNMTGYSLFSFMDGFLGYNQIKMHPEDIEKTTFVTMWGTFCYKNREGACTILEETVFEIEKIPTKAKSCKMSFGVRSGKLLVFVVREKGIKIEPDKVNAIQQLLPPRTQKEVRGFLGRLNYIALFISKLTEKCDPIFLLLKKYNSGVWNKDCQKTFDKVKHYLSSAPVLMPPNPDRPLILYLAVFENFMGCVLGQHDEYGRNERVIYYLIYVNQKAVKGRAIVDFLASRALEDYEPLNFDFLNEDLMYLATTEEDSREGEWEIRDLKIIKYRKLVLELIEEFDDITFYYLPQDENQMADALATLASMVKAKKILEEFHKGVCGTHANGFTMARQIIRFGYYWSTMKGDCISYAKKFHKCQIYKDKIHVPHSPLHVMTSPWPFSMWGMDVIGPNLPKASNGYRFIFVVINYFTKWVKAASYANVTKSTVNKFLKESYVVYGIKAVLPIEVEIPSLRVLAELKLDEAEWIQSRYDQLNLIEEKRLKAIRHVLKKILPIQKDFRGKWMPNWEGPYVVKKTFSGGALILTEMDGKSLPNPVNSDSIKKYFT